MKAFRVLFLSIAIMAMLMGPSYQTAQAANRSDQPLPGESTPFTPILADGCETAPVWGVVASCASSLEILPQNPGFASADFVVFLPSVMNKYSSPSGTLEQVKSTSNTSMYADQKFADLTNYSNYLADDFLIGGTGLNVQEIYIPGNLYNGGTTLANASQLVFQIYTDAVGKPAGDPVSGGAFWNLAISPSDSRITLTQSAPMIYGNVKFTFSTPLFLAPGRYWLVFYPDMPVLQGQYGRYVSETTNGNDAVVMNPGGGFLPLATSWTSIQSPNAWNLVQQDLAFRIKGY
jgi:hypothetical protein